jgi:hypothetical protein
MGKTAILQKARLLDALRKTRRLFPPEFLFIHPLHVFDPIVAADVQPAFDRTAVDALFFQLAADVERPVAAHPAHMQQCLDEALVRNQPFGRKRRHNPGGGALFTTTLHQLADQFLTAVLTARQPGQRPITRFFRVETGLVLAQASASSGSASSASVPEATTGAAMVARIFFSMSAAMAGFSFRNWRALSLP